MRLTDEYVLYIVKDIAYRGIVEEDLGDELTDHICTLVEAKTSTGIRFIDAYGHTIADFDKDNRLLEQKKDG